MFVHQCEEVVQFRDRIFQCWNDAYVKDCDGKWRCHEHTQDYSKEEISAAREKLLRDNLEEVKAKYKKQRSSN